MKRMIKTIIGIMAAMVIVIAIALSNQGMDISKMAGFINSSDSSYSSEQDSSRNIDDMTVFKTKSGNCYHVDGCSYLRSSSIATTYGEAKAEGLLPCSRCQPDRWLY